MSSLLKDIYSREFFDSFSDTLEQVVPSFNRREFIQRIFENDWESKELKERMRHTALVINAFFPNDFATTAKLIENIIDNLRQRNITESSIEFMFLPDYIEIYGINDFDISIKLMEFVTQYTSCEFAVRRFIVKYGDKMLQQMERWSLHHDHRVRRLASEGSRPRLPWAIALPELKINPSRILPILENLKNDPSEYVRRSVANNLNDISKDNPDIALVIFKQWRGHSKETDAIIKHASRTLLKRGHPVILEYFELSDNTKIVADKFNIHTPIVEIGNHLEFSFSIQNTDSKSLSVRVEYGIFYLRSNGQHSKKVFKISERQLKPNEKLDIRRKQSFKVITTRRFYLGPHKLSLIINGLEKKIEKFELADMSHKFQ